MIEENLKDRAELLSKKYSLEPFSEEDQKRLQILTEKASLAFPRVTEADFKDLADARAEVESIFDDIKDIM